MLLVGLGRLATGHLQPVPAGGTAPLPTATASVGLLLVLHAFAAACTALTGVEAISNGVPAFRRPEPRNARRTLVAMGVILGSLFVGVSFLAVRVGVRPYESGNPTLIGQLARRVLDGSPAGQLFFYLFQAATLAIVVLAANTSFADFPRLVSFAAGDAFLPRRFTKRGQRLVYSGGIMALSAAAAVVTVAFGANYNRMLPLYAIGVFTSFTLSQAGMTRRHLRLREPGWRYGLVVNGAGAVVTLVVLLDIVQTKFLAGAWSGWSCWRCPCWRCPCWCCCWTGPTWPTPGNGRGSGPRWPRRSRHPSPATRSWCWSTGWTGPSSTPCSPRASSTRCRSPPCASPRP
jgi:amino acid transporter